MGKVCAVPGCNSGSQKDLKQRELDDVRKCTIFSIPKCPQLRKEWSNELGIELKDNNRICELHFLYEDLNMDDDITLMKNGDHFVSYRQRIRLKTNARPVRDVVEAYRARRGKKWNIA